MGIDITTFTAGDEGRAKLSDEAVELIHNDNQILDEPSLSAGHSQPPPTPRAMARVEKPSSAVVRCGVHDRPLWASAEIRCI